MTATKTIAQQLTEEQDHIIEEIVEQEGNRLFNFIRKSIPDELEAEDLLQDVFYQLVESYRLLKPIEQASAWLYAVTKNKIRDRFRKKKPVSESDLKPVEEAGELSPGLFDQLIDPGMGADNEMMQDWIMEALEESLDELPEEQRQVFIWHEIEGKSFDEISKITNEKKNTLISRKRYAVLYLREHLRELYDEFIND